MKRSDLIRSIQINYSRMKEKDAAMIVDTMSDTIKDSIANGDKIEIRGFGTVAPRNRAPKVGYNPLDGQPMHLAAGRTILFRPSRELTKKMNG